MQVRASAEVLTRRAHRVVELLARGFSDRQIAVELGISRRAANAHVRNVLAKLGLRSRWQARERRLVQDG
jgi:DNA-binding NarL/FixJ family response regulator